MINIQPTLYGTNQVNFKSRNINDDDVIAFDDEMSHSCREYIRDTYESRHLPYYNIIENSGRLSEYKLKELIDGLCGTKPRPHHYVEEEIEPEIVSDIEEPAEPTDEINADMMSLLPLYNVKPIYTTGNYRGSTLNAKLECVELIKKAGVKHVVDLEGYDRVKDACEENDIEYFHIPIAEDLSEMDAFKSKKDIELGVMQWASVYRSKESLQAAKDSAVTRWERKKDDYIDKFVKMINLLQEGNTYIGCEYGISRTNNAMLLNHLFNPKATKTPSCRTKFNDQYMFNIKSFYENLTPEHKAQMGWTEEFDKNFIPRLNALQNSKIEFNY